MTVTVTNELRARLVEAFPRRLTDDVEAVLGVLPSSTHAVPARDVGPIVLDSEPLRVPTRVYFPMPDDASAAHLSERQRRVLGCLYTRHHDGYVRERALRSIIDARDAWIAPYVVQLVGEYVVEIVRVIEERLDSAHQPEYGEFVVQNDAFIALTRARVISYWNCYWRHTAPARGGYPAQRRELEGLRRDFHRER